MSDAFLEETLAVFQPRTETQLTKEDARQIVENFAGFFRILDEWDRVEKADKDGCDPRSQRAE